MKRFILLVVLGIVALSCLEIAPHRVTPAAASPPHFVVAQVVPPPPLAEGRESVEGLPVPVYRESRVTQAEISTPTPRARHRMERGSLRQSLPTVAPREVSQRRDGNIVAGRLSATEPRAEADARVQLEHEVTTWLAPEVPTWWKPPVELLNRLVVRTRTKPIVKDYGTLYEATLDVDLSPARRTEIIEVYHHDLVKQRMVRLGGMLGFMLVCLAALSGYIRADEATKGYYTNWLRAVAAAGVGASGVLIYQLLT